NAGSINQAYAGRGAVTGGDNSYVGGFVGINVAYTSDGTSFPGSITQSYALGPATGGNAAVAAGFAALNLGKLDQVYAVGLVSVGAGGKTGGLVALNSGTLPSLPGAGSTPTAGVSVTNSYWDRQTTGQETSAGGTALDTAVLAGAVPPGFAPTIWTHGSYPHLINLGTQATTPGPPVLPPETPPPGPPDQPGPPPPSVPLNQQTPAQLQLVQNVQNNVPASPPDLVNTQVALTGPPQP